MAGLLVCVLLTQTLLPLPAHTRIGTDERGQWTLVCRWLDPTPEEQGEDPQRAPGMVFSSLASELLAPGRSPETTAQWFSVMAADDVAISFLAHHRDTAYDIRGPPQ